jgi:hypothetical protein
VSAVIDVDLGEDDDPPFPFLVAGFVAGENVAEADLLAAFARRVAGMPPGACVYRHQYGGLTCHQATLVGYGVDVPADDAVRTAIAEIIARWWESFGEPIEPRELQRWQRALGTMLPGGVRGGEEAFLRSLEGPPISCLRGLPVVRPVPDLPGELRMELPGEGQVTLAGVYGDEHERALQQVGEDVGTTPIVALLWGNSD